MLPLQLKWMSGMNETQNPWNTWTAGAWFDGQRPTELAGPVQARRWCNNKDKRGVKGGGAKCRRGREEGRSQWLTVGTRSWASSQVKYLRKWTQLCKIDFGWIFNVVNFRGRDSPNRGVVHSKKSSYIPPKNPKKIQKIHGFLWGFKIRTPYLGVNNSSNSVFKSFFIYITLVHQKKLILKNPKK